MARGAVVSMRDSSSSHINTVESAELDSTSDVSGNPLNPRRLWTPQGIALPCCLPSNGWILRILSDLGVPCISLCSSQLRVQTCIVWEILILTSLQARFDGGPSSLALSSVVMVRARRSVAEDPTGQGRRLVDLCDSGRISNNYAEIKKLLENMSTGQRRAVVRYKQVVSETEFVKYCSTCYDCDEVFCVSFYCWRIIPFNHILVWRNTLALGCKE